jgi:predicted component of type VI protein secretion system
MRIGVVGGISRWEPRLAQLAAQAEQMQAGQIEFHVGGVRMAKLLARQLRRASVVLSRCGVARFAALLDA